MRRLALILFTMIAMAMATMAKPSGYTEVEKTDSLLVYYPHFGRIDLVCGTMPSRDEADVIFCAEAAYTEKKEKTFSHMNIDGNHVSGGVWYEGTPCQETEAKIGNTGAFAFYDGKWHFVYGAQEAEALLQTAAEHGGMGFCQAIVYLDGHLLPHTRHLRYPAKETYYRVVAEMNGKLCIIDSRDSVSYGTFVRLLEKMPITHAIYVDMGKGWNYSWYRSAVGKTHLIHRTPGEYTTNWITFYK